MSGGALLTPLLVTATEPVPKRGAALADVSRIQDAVVAWEEGSITYAGPVEGYEGPAAESVHGSIVPGFVDAHTHLPFFGWRADEHAARLAGRSYRDLHGEGGIFRSARMFNEASDDEVLGFCRPLLKEMAAHGTTTVELKTGYGLSVDAELRQARLARRLAEEADQTCVVTLLACHAIPENETAESWVRKACDELIPAAAEEGIVDAVDIYVEDIAFDLDALEAVSTAARANELRLHCHVEQLSNMHAAERAVELGATTVDHLNHLDGAGVATLGHGDSVAVLLPASTLVLGSEPPPARALIESGAAVALATDFNPGTSPVLSMPETIALACALYRLSPLEALVAATTNAAHGVGLGPKLGVLAEGMRADLVVLEGEPEAIPYRPGHNPVIRTYIGGNRV